MARDYGRVHTAFWTDGKVRSLSDAGKALGLYLLTCPHSNMLGAYLLPDAYAADDLGWSSERVSKGFEELFAIGFAQRFKDGRHIFICNFLKWNGIENPNVATGAYRAAMSLPADEEIFPLLLKALEPHKDKFRNSWETLVERFGKRFRNTETEPETDPEPETEIMPAGAGAPVSEASPKSDSPTFEEFWGGYPTDKNMPKKQALQQWDRLSTDQRKQAVAAIPGFKKYCSDNARWYRAVYADKFLSQHKFDGYTSEKPPDPVVTHPSWNGTQAKMENAIGIPNFASYFAAAELEIGPPAVIAVRSGAAKNLIEQKFGAKLRALFGTVEITVVRDANA